VNLAALSTDVKLATDTLVKAVDDLSQAAKTGGPLPEPVRAAAEGTNGSTQLVEDLRKLPNSQNISLDKKGDLDKVAEELLNAQILLRSHTCF